MVPVWIKFLICAGLIFFSGKRVARYGDVIAEKTGLGGLWIGVILISLTTSLPELFTGLGSTIFVGAPDLTVGNLLGANSYNLANIAILDAAAGGAPLLGAVSSGQLLTAVLSLAPLTIVAAGIFLGCRGLDLSLANFSIYSALIVLAYLASIRIIFEHEQKQRPASEKEDRQPGQDQKDDISLQTAWLRFGFFALIIAGAGVWLSYIGDDLAQSLGLGRNFVGSLFLGFATTLPEITVSVAAIRLGAREMAVANMVGSNLFNMTIIAVNDIFFRKASIFSALSVQHVFMALMVIVMTVVVCAALILKPKARTRLGVSLYSILLLVVFVAGMYVSFLISK